MFSQNTAEKFEGTPGYSFLKYNYHECPNSNLDPEDGIETHYDKILLCSRCGNQITSYSEGATIHGSFEHSFLNPDGIMYQIGCFKKAAGCISSERFILEFTWFHPFPWCFVFCSDCGRQLGWKYKSNNNDVFYGLILKLLCSM